jgi:site-specific recombinase XerD
MRSRQADLMNAVESYLTSQHQLSPKTIPGYRTVLVNLGRSIGPKATIADLTTTATNRYLASLIAAGKRHMARNTAITVKTFGAWLVETGISEAEQFLYGTIRVPRVPKDGRDAFTDAEVSIILRVARSPECTSFARDYALVTLALGHGPRLNEMRELTLDDIDFHQGLVTIRGETSKSGRDRRIPLDAVAPAGIDAYVQDWRPPSTSRVLFLTEAGQPFTYHGFLHCFTRLGARLAKAGVPKFMAHRCRNTWATNAHRQGYSVFDIQDMGGWRTLEMARRYAKGRPISELRRIPTPLAAIVNQSRPRLKAM